MEAVKEEGQRWGREIEAQNDFMTVTIQAAEGNLTMLELGLQAANSVSKRVGKLFISYNSSQLALICFVPEGHTVSPKEWIQSVIQVIGGELIEDSDTIAKAHCKSQNGQFNLYNGKNLSQGEAVSFEATAASVAWLRSKGLFPPAAAATEEDDDFIPEW